MCTQKTVTDPENRLYSGLGYFLYSKAKKKNGPVSYEKQRRKQIVPE